MYRFFTFRRLAAVSLAGILSWLPALTSTAADALLPPSFCLGDICVDSSPATTPEPPPIASGNSDNTINWNPGLYFGFKIAQITAKGVEGAPNVLRNNAMCRPGGEQVQGIRLKFLWRELEPNGGGVYDFSLIDTVLDFFRNNGCGDRPRRLMLTLDFMANKKLADQLYCVPPDLEREAVSWANNGGTTRCAAPIWLPNSDSAKRYRQLVLAIANRYKDEPLLEYLSAKGEGALGINKRDPSFVFEQAFSYLMDIGKEVRAIAPKVAYAYGTNNFQVGKDEWLESRVVPIMEETGGMGVRWPDTFHHDKRSAPFTAHHKYYPNMTRKFMMAGELQIPGNRFDTYEDAWQSCCNPTGYNTGAANNSKFSPASSNHTHGASHVVVITTFSSYPEEDALAVWKEHNYETYFNSCPTSWTNQGLRCVTGRTL